MKKYVSESTFTAIADLLNFLIGKSEDPETMAHVDAVSDALEKDLLEQMPERQQVAELSRIMGLGE